MFSADFDGVKSGAEQAFNGYKNSVTGVVKSAYDNGSIAGETFANAYNRGIADHQKKQLEKSSNGIDGNSFAALPVNDDKPKDPYNPNDGTKAITSGGNRPTNINIHLNKEMVGQIVINPLTMTQGAEEVRDLVSQALAQILNSSNRVAFD